MNLFARWRERRRLDRELAAEMDEHLRELMEDLIERGLPPAEAARQARLRFGNPTLEREKSRQAWSWTSLEQFAFDLRFALRQLARTPGFTLTALATLALGIGVSTAIFTLVDSVLLRPLAYPESSRLVIAWEHVRFLGPDPVGPNPRHFDRWQRQTTAFRSLTLFQQGANGVSLANEHPRLVGTVRAQSNLFQVLQVTPFLGRSFQPEDDMRGRDRVAIITYSLWQTLFQADPNVIGKTLRLEGTTRVVIGVLPPDFTFATANALSNRTLPGAPPPGLFYPAALDFAAFSYDGEYGNWIALGRLQPGVSLAQAEAQLNTVEFQLINERVVSRHASSKDELFASLQPMQEAIVGGESTTRLWLLMAAVLGLLLIACLNLANAQLGRALTRTREIAVRSALGAGRARLLSSALAESLILAGLGGISGMLLALAALGLFRRYSPLDLPRLAEVRPHPQVFLFAALLTIGSCLVFGLLPVLRLLRADPQTTLQRTTLRAAGIRHGGLLRACLIALQVFGCTALLLLTGLFSKSLLHLLRTDKGFDTAGIVAAQVNLPEKAYQDPPQRIAFDDAVLQNLRALPGIQRAALISAMPLEGESWIEELRLAGQPDRDTPLLNLRWVSPGYFEAVRQPLVAGRYFEERDRNLNSAILSQGEAASIWLNQNALGAHIKLEDRPFTVIGIVADSRNTSLKTAPPRMAYLHYKDRPPYMGTIFIVRSSVPSRALAPRIRQAIWQQDPGVTIARVKTLDAQLTDSLATERFETFLLIGFGVAALLLAMLGIYGVLSYSVAARRQEIGIRMAVGASRAKIYRLALSEAAAPVLLGLLAGLALSLILTRAVEKLLYGVKGLDLPVTLLITILFLFAALAAAFLPARRAASVDPLQALRAE